MNNPNMLEMVTATLRYRRKAIADAMTKNNALMFQLRRKGRIDLIDGGRTITEPILYGENANHQWYTGREVLNVAGQEVLTSAEYDWKQYACGVSISGLEMMQNSPSKHQIHDMMKTRIMHAEKTIVNKNHESAYSDGTASAGKEFGGLDLLVNDVAGATVGGINSGTATWWDNKRATIAGGPTTANIYANMLNMCLSLSRGSDKVDLIIGDNTYYSVLSQYLQGQQRFMDAKLADAGFRNLMFEGVPVVADGGDGGFAQVGMYFLNCASIRLIMHKRRNNVPLGGPRRPLTEDSDTVILAGMGNFTSNNRARNGRLTSV